MLSRRSAAAFLTFLVAFAVSAYLLPQRFVHAEGTASGKQCPAEEKNKKEYQPARPWNTSYKEKRGDTVYTILNLFGKPCKDVTNEEVVTGHCIREDTCKADKTAEGKKPQTCLETKECPPGSNVGNTPGGADENEELPYYDEPKPDNSDGVLPLKENPNPDTKIPQQRIDDAFKPFETKQESALKSLWDAAQTIFNPPANPLTNSTMDGFGPQQILQPIPDNGTPGSGVGQKSLYEQAFNTNTTGFGSQTPTPQPDTPAAAPQEQTWGQWFAEKTKALGEYVFGPSPETPAVANADGDAKETPVPTAPEQKDLTDPFYTEEPKPVDTTPKAEPFKNYGMVEFDKYGIPVGSDNWLSKATADKIERLENDPNAEYYPDVKGDRDRLAQDLKDMEQRVQEYNKGPACAPSCTPQQVAAYQAKGEALRQEQSELMKSRDVYNELVKAHQFEQQLERPVTAEQLKPFTGPGPQTEAARNVFNAETAALREIGQQQVDAFWNNKEVPQPDFVAEQSRIAGNAFAASDNKITPEIQRQAYQDLTQLADARDQARINETSVRLDELNRKIAEMPVYDNAVDPFNGGMAFNQERLALEREAARLQAEVEAASDRLATRETVRDFLDDHPNGDRIGEMLLNNKNPAVERAAIDAMKGYMKESEGYEHFLDGKAIDTRIRDQVDKNFWRLPTGNPFAVNGTDIAAQNNFNDQLYTTKMERYESQLSMLTGDTPMSTELQNKLDTLSGNYNGLYKAAYAVQDYLRDTYSLDGATEKPYYVLSAPAALLAAGIVDPLVGGTIGSREYFLSAPDNDLRENLSSWTGDLALTGVNAAMLPWARMAGAVGFEARTFGEIASIGESVNAYTRVGSSLEPVFAGAGVRTEATLAEGVNAYTRVGSSLEPSFGNAAARSGATITQDGFDAAAFAAARDVAPLEVNSFRPGAGLTAANDDFRTIVSANDNVLGGGPVGGGGARSIAAGGGDDVVAAGRAAEGGGPITGGTVTSLADARAAAGARATATETGSTFATEGSAALKTDPFAGKGVTTVEGQAFQPNRFTTADAALAKGSVANDNVVGGAAIPKTTAPATAPTTVPYGEFGYRPPVVSPTWYQPDFNTIYSQRGPDGNLLPTNSYPVSYDGLNQFTPTPVTPVSPVALSTASPRPISPIPPVTPYVSPAAAPPKFVTPADYIRQTYGDAAGRAAREAQAYGASPFDWANYMSAVGGAGGVKDGGGAPSTPYPTTEYKPTAVIKPLRPPVTQAPKAIAEVAVQALKEIGVIPGAVVETHPAQFPKELFDHDTNTYFQRLGDGRYLAQNFETGEILTVPSSDIGDLIDASRYDGTLEVAPGVFLKEPYRAETTFADAARGVVENGLGISPTAQSLADRSGVTNGARPIASNRLLNPDVTPEQIPLIEVKNVPGSRDLRALDYPEALAIREFNSSLANYSKALASGAEISRASQLVSNAYDDLLERGIFADEAGNLYRTESPAYPVAVPVSPQMAAQAAYAVVVPIDPMVREFVTGSTDETFAFDVPDLRILSSNFGVQPPITTDEAILLKRANDILESTRSRDSLLYLFDDAPLSIRPQDGYIVRPNGEVVARPIGTNPLPGALPDRFVPSGPVPPLPVQLVKINSSPSLNNRVRETYEAQDYQGRRVAAVEMTIDGAVARVDSMRAYRPGEQTWTTRSNTLTPATIRSMLSQIKAAHPEVQAISGQRISGEQFAGQWDPADVGTSVEVPLAEVPSETIAVSVPEVPEPVAVAPANRQLFDPLPIALALGLTFGSPIPMDAISNVLGDAARSFSNAAQARPKVQTQPGRPSERDLARRDQAIADIGKVKKGIASWYSTGSNGGTNPSDVTASGALHRNDVNTVAMLGAAPKYPWGTVLMVKNVQKRLRSGAPNPAYGREIEVVVTSTGSQWNRDLDLSPKARDEIGIGADGVAEVEYTVKYIPPLNQIGYWKGRTDLNNGTGALPKGTFDTQLAALRGNTQLAFGDTGFTNQPTIANTGLNNPGTFVAPDLSAQISGNTAYRPIVIPSWQLPTPQLTVTPAEPLAANPTPAVERGTLADIPEPLAANPTPRVERGDLPEIPVPKAPRTRSIVPVSADVPAPKADDAPFTTQPEPAAPAPARVPQTPSPSPVESLGVNTRRPQFEESPTQPLIANNDNTPIRKLGSPIPLSPIPNNRMLAAYVPPKANPGINDFQQPTLYANSQGGIWPTVDGARQALVLDGEILPPAPIARAGSEVASPRPDLDLTANPNPIIAPTRVIGAPRPETVLDGEIIPPSPVGRSDSQVGEPKPVLDLQANKPGIAPTRNLEAPAQPAPLNGLTAPSQIQRIAYTGSNALGQPKVVLNLDILGNKALVTARSVDAVTIPSVEEIESLLRQLLARHPEVSELGVGAIPNDKALTVVRPPVNVLPALENELITGPTLYVNGRGEIWPSLANAEIDMGISNIVAQIRSEKIIDTGIRAIAQQVGAEKAIDTGIAQIAKQVGAEKTIDDGIRQIGKQIGAEKVIDDGIAQIAWQVSTQKKIDDAMKAIVSPERAIDDGIADIVSRIQPGEGVQPIQPARTSVPQVPTPRLAEVPVTPERMLEDAIRDFAGAPSAPPVARTSPRPDVSVPPPLPSRPFMERAKDIWSDTKLVARISRGVILPAGSADSSVKASATKNVAVNTMNMIVAYSFTGPYTVLTWPALNVGWRYVFNKDYRADVNNVASRVSSALANARAERERARAAEELLRQSAPRASVPRVEPSIAQAENPISIEDGIRDIVSNVRTNPTPETIIDEGIAEIASNVRGTPPSLANDLGKTVAQFAADHPSLTNGNAPETPQPRATDPLTQTVTEFAADKPKISETSTWDNFLEWIKFGGGGGRGGGTSGGDGTDEPDSDANAVKRGLLSIARLIPGLSSLINALPPTNPTPTDAPLKGAPETAQKNTPTPDKKPVVPTPPSPKQPPTQPAIKQPPVPPPSSPVPPPNPVQDTNPKVESAPTGGTNGGSGLGGLSSLLSGLMKGLGLGQPKPAQPMPTQPKPNGGIAVQITAQPNPVAGGEAVLVSWTSVNATTCNVFNASSTKVASGVPGGMFKLPNVTATGSFKVYCSNALGQYASATVQVLLK